MNELLALDLVLGAGQLTSHSLAALQELRDKLQEARQARICRGGQVSAPWHDLNRGRTGLARSDEHANARNIKSFLGSDD